MDDKVESFLKRIREIESSGGKNFDHETMQTGIHKGDTAIGNYGLMPNTVREIINRERAKGNDEPEFELLEQMNPQEMKEFLESSPVLERHLAKSLASVVLDKQPTEEMAAFAWNQGHNLSPERIREKDFESHPYTQKFLAAQGSGELPGELERAPASGQQIAEEPTNEIPEEESFLDKAKRLLNLTQAPGRWADKQIENQLAKADNPEFAQVFKDNLEDSMGGASMVGSIAKAPSALARSNLMGDLLDRAAQRGSKMAPKSAPKAPANLPAQVKSDLTTIPSQLPGPNLSRADKGFGKIIHKGSEGDKPLSSLQALLLKSKQK